MKYLKNFGFSVYNDAFADHSWYFRNTLVRANYNHLTRGIHATTKYLEYFFENMLLGAEHETGLSEKGLPAGMRLMGDSKGKSQRKKHFYFLCWLSLYQK